MFVLPVMLFVLAQSTENPVMDRAIRNLAGKQPRAWYSGYANFEYKDAGVTLCSVPLLEMPVPKDTTFTMKIIRPPQTTTDPMPRAKVPAPACKQPQPEP